MQIALEVLTAGLFLFFLYGLIRYSGPAQIEVIGIFAADGTRLDRPQYRPAPVAFVGRSLTITASGEAQVSFNADGIVVRGPGRVTIGGQ